mgnify:CR=1 FL=1
MLEYLGLDKKRKHEFHASSFVVIQEFVYLNLKPWEMTNRCILCPTSYINKKSSFGVTNI